MTPHQRTVKITALHAYSHNGANEMLELSGQPLNGRLGSDGPIGHTYDRRVQDTLYLAQRGTGYVTVGLVSGYLGDRIVSVEEVEAVA